MSDMQEAEIRLQRGCSALVECNVYACMSMVVAELESLGSDFLEDADTWAPACSECGEWLDADADDTEPCPCCAEYFDVDHAAREIYEWWAVGSWFADKLEAHGALVVRELGLCLWARETTGQAIMLDHIVREIAKELDR